MKEYFRCKHIMSVFFFFIATMMWVISTVFKVTKVVFNRYNVHRNEVFACVLRTSRFIPLFPNPGGGE